jgi:transcriptional regulator with XRE-family HTH domain
MTTAAVSLIFSGKRQPSVRTAEKIAGYFGVSVDRFLSYLSVLTGASVVTLPETKASLAKA